MNPFGNWKSHDAESHNTKVSDMKQAKVILKTAKAHNLANGVGDVTLSEDEIRSWSGGTPDQPKAKARSSYNPTIVNAWLKEQGIPCPMYELTFALPRKWRFDLAWPGHRLALEVQGGIFAGGRHNRGAALLKEWEKLNEAAALGYRVMFCQPADLCTEAMAETLRRALAI